MILKPAVYSVTKSKHDVYQSDANELIKNIEGDVLYLDPPYNSREYGANYHILNTIARYDNFTPKGKTGLREYNHSQYCQRKNASASLEQLVKDAKFKYIFLSYNNEGLITFEEIKSILSKYGRYDLEKRDYQRFKADNKRVHKANKTLEYLHILEKDG
jgi:adenine-specific DNA-methyltransferase